MRRSKTLRKGGPRTQESECRRSVQSGRGPTDISEQTRDSPERTLAKGISTLSSSTPSFYLLKSFYAFVCVAKSNPRKPMTFKICLLRLLIDADNCLHHSNGKNIAFNFFAHSNKLCYTSLLDAKRTAMNAVLMKMQNSTNISVYVTTSIVSSSSTTTT